MKARIWYRRRGVECTSEADVDLDKRMATIAGGSLIPFEQIEEIVPEKTDKTAAPNEIPETAKEPPRPTNRRATRVPT